MENHDIVRELHSIRDFIRLGMSRFAMNGLHFGHGTDNAWDEALALVLSVLHLPMDCDANILDARLLPDEKRGILALFERRIHERVPVPYLTHTAWFCGLPFHVDGRVAIPRSPVADMVKARFRPWYRGRYPYQILDLCAGSGCVGIACAFAFPEAEIVLADIADDALAVAEMNIARHGVQQAVFTLRSDLFADVDGVYDLIVATPPNLDNRQLFALPAEYRHEPTLALASGERGIDHAVRILQQAAPFLADDGILVLDAGNSRHPLEDAFPGIEFEWVDTGRPGQAVLVMGKADLEFYADQLALGPDTEEEGME